MQLDAATISVITSGIVAIAGLFLPLLLNFISESQKWRREQKINQTAKIDQALTDVLKVLAIFRSGDVQSATKQTIPSAFSDLLGKYYVWEQTISSYLGKEYNEGLLQLRQKFEKGDHQTLYGEGPAYADTVIRFTKIALSKVK